jgi:serine/threonine-protein kinase
MRRTRQALTSAELDQTPAAPFDIAPDRTAAMSRTAVVPQAMLSPGTGQAPSRSRRLRPWLAQWREHQRAIGLFALVLVVTAALFFFTVGPGATTAVPRVIGSTDLVARKALDQAHLDTKVDRSYNETVKAGLVLTSDPLAGREVRRGSTVTLTVSQGPERHDVPQLTGRTQADAEQRLSDATLTVGELRKEYSETVPQGQVISTSPGANTAVKRATPVTLVISAGRQPINLRDWTGQPVDQAVAAMTKVKLKVDTTRQQWSDTVPKGAVITQSPATGTLFAGDLVTMVVSKGPQLVVVPDVIGQQEQPAQTALEQLGFKVKIERAFGGYFGTVRLQSIAPNSKAPQGSTITLTVV